MWIDRDVRVDDLGFRVRGTVPTGAADDAAYVLVHGIGMSYRTMRGVHDVLAADTAVYSVDMPGFGGCPVPDRSVSIGEMAATLGVVCDRVGARRVVVVGHSMGAQWAVELAIARPDLVAGAVLIGPVTDREHRSVRRQAVALGVDVLHEPPLTSVQALSDYVRASTRWYVRQVRHMVGYPIDERIGEVGVPVLIVRGGTDTVAGRDWCRLLRDRAADAELVVVPAGAHNVQVSRPRAVASAILDFVRRRVADLSPD